MLEVPKGMPLPVTLGALQVLTYSAGATGGAGSGLGIAGAIGGAGSGVAGVHPSKYNSSASRVHTTQSRTSISTGIRAPELITNHSTVARLALF
jgi:hypothetical protein